MLERARKKENILRPSWISYGIYLALPIFFIASGLVSIGKIRFGMLEYTIMFGIPIVVMILGCLKLGCLSLSTSRDSLRLKRFTLKHGIEDYTIPLGSITHAALSNSLKEKYLIQQKSGLGIVPVSVLYIEWDSGKKIAFDVSMLNNRDVLKSLAVVKNIDTAKYRAGPFFG